MPPTFALRYDDVANKNYYYEIGFAIEEKIDYNKEYLLKCLSPFFLYFRDTA